ncbi:CsbD family protein [Caballeronia glebae]|uniref:CsbD family protein n=1 Tax=Caballeronia glebae TaxID=1777143 RepID=A0A158BJH8_9BURK|nr:CsbD family protein [Caballeronia glebae]SAK70201.1 CsbD family protein [Caballeronia glebae]
MDSNTTEGNVKEVAGTVQDAAGKVQDAAGELLAKTGTQAVGKARELGGKAQQLYADTTEIVRDKTVDSPLTALAVAAGLGFLLGAIWATANSAPPRSYPKRYRGDDRY